MMGFGFGGVSFLFWPFGGIYLIKESFKTENK